MEMMKIFGMKEEILGEIQNIEKIFVYQIKSKNGKLEEDVKKGNIVESIGVEIENIDIINIVMEIDNNNTTTMFGIEGLNQLQRLGIVSWEDCEAEAKVETSFLLQFLVLLHFLFLLQFFVICLNEK